MKKYRNFDGFDAKFAQNINSKRCLGLILRKNATKLLVQAEERFICH